MRRSIRWRLQAWYALVLLAVVAGFALILYQQVRTARFREADAALREAVLHLDTNLKRFPPRDLDVAAPPPAPRIRQQGEDRVATALGPRATRILVGRSVKAELAELRTFAWQVAGAGAVVLAVGLAGGWLVSARILRPVEAISATA